MHCTFPHLGNTTIDQSLYLNTISHQPHFQTRDVFLQILSNPSLFSKWQASLSLAQKLKKEKVKVSITSLGPDIRNAIFTFEPLTYHIILDKSRKTLPIRHFTPRPRPYPQHSKSWEGHTMMNSIVESLDNQCPRLCSAKKLSVCQCGCLKKSCCSLMWNSLHPQLSPLTYYQPQTLFQDDEKDLEEISSFLNSF